MSSRNSGEYDGYVLPVNKPQQKKKGSSGSPVTVLLLIIVAVLAVLIIKSALKKETTYIPGTVKDVNAWAYTPGATATPEPELRPTAEASGLLPIYYKANTSQKRVAITIQGMPSSAEIEKVLEKCSEYNSKVTFFLTGSELGTFASSWPMVILGGHQIESRGMAQIALGSLSAEELDTNLDVFTDSLRFLIGSEYCPHFFRPSDMNDYDNSRLHTALSQRGYYGIASWSLASPTSINQIEPGQIICISLESYGASRLGEMLAALNASGYTAVTLNSLFEYPENLESYEND